MDPNTAAVVIAAISAAASIMGVIITTRVRRDVKAVKTNINGRVDELIAAAHAAGVKQEKERTK